MIDISVWDKWAKCHNQDQQKRSLEKAKTSACTPLSVLEDGTAQFSGSHGYYKTSLTSCTCVDFARKQLPCKHMYRLAIELGALQAEADIDPRAIKRPRVLALPLNDAIHNLDRLGNETLSELHMFLYRSLYEQKCDIIGVIVNDSYITLVNNGVLEICDDLRAALSAFGRNELRSRIVAYGITDFKKNMKTEDQIEWAYKNVPNIRELIPDAIAVRLTDDYYGVARPIYSYLIKRLDPWGEIY